MFTRSDSATFSNKWYPLCIRVAAMNSLFSLLLIFLIFEPNFAATTDKQKERKNPRLISLFPQGSHQGSFLIQLLGVKVLKAFILFGLIAII